VTVLGNPNKFTEKFTFADVILPFESVVVSHVMTTLPVPVASGPDTGGTSFAGRRVAVSVGRVANGVELVGDEEELPHATESNAIVTHAKDRRFITPSTL
jgi:hypothetical protein